MAFNSKTSTDDTIMHSNLGIFSLHLYDICMRENHKSSKAKEIKIILTMPDGPSKTINAEKEFGTGYQHQFILRVLSYNIDTKEINEIDNI